MSIMGQFGRPFYYGLGRRCRLARSLARAAAELSSRPDTWWGNKSPDCAVAAATEQRQQSVRQLLCLCQLPPAVSEPDELPPRRSIGGAADDRRGAGNYGPIPLGHGHRAVGSRAAWPFLSTPIYKIHL